MSSIYPQNKSKNFFALLLSYLIFGSFVLIYTTYIIVKDSNSIKNYKFIHSHLDAEFLNNEIHEFLQPKTLRIKNILEDEEILKSENCSRIFFIETHMDRTRTLENARISCTIESAATINPDSQIYFILLTNSTKVTLNFSEQAKVLLSYSNIYIRYLNIYEFSKGTVLENLIANNTILHSEYPIEHMADVMRALILSKYSGTYLDLDVLSLVPLAKIEYENFACPEDTNRITNAVIRINEKGKKVMNLYIEKLSTSYNSMTYSDNGPKLFSESIKAFCNGTDLKTNEYTKCDEFTILPTEKCYPVNYGGYKKFYEQGGSTYVFGRIKEFESYFVHIWNKMNELQGQNFTLTFNTSAPYIELAKKYCPNILKTTEKYF